MEKKRMATEEETNFTAKTVELNNKAFSIVENAGGKYDVVVVKFNPEVNYNEVQVIESMYNKSEAIERFKIAVADALL